MSGELWPGAIMQHEEHGVGMVVWLPKKQRYAIQHPTPTPDNLESWKLWVFEEDNISRNGWELVTKGLKPGERLVVIGDE